MGNCKRLYQKVEQKVEQKAKDLSSLNLVSLWIQIIFVLIPTGNLQRIELELKSLSLSYK